MKIKALRTKNEPKEFVQIDYHHNLKFCSIGTSDIPKALPETATMDNIIQYYNDKNIDVDLSGFELVEFDLIESDKIGADIRNKLTPPYNLLSLLKLFFKEKDNIKKEELVKFIKKEMENSEKSIIYIANLL